MQYILQGLQCGFHISFKRVSNLRAAKKNMFPAEEHPEVICRMSVNWGVLGPFNLEELPGVHISKFGGNYSQRAIKLENGG